GRGEPCRLRNSPSPAAHSCSFRGRGCVRSSRRSRRSAKRHNIAYSKDKLKADAGYNATLGAHYLGEQIDAFGGSYILNFIAYNAGPKRVPEWI
ncbi:transglycosylase SLT domain-containing protein, partial [Rhizobium ruizarguesonis]